MQKNIKELFPQWTNEKQDRNLTITDDFDSLISASILNQIFGYEINYYYSFGAMYRLNPDDKRKTIGVDMALRKGLCWDNHVTMLKPNDYVNPNSANLNAINKISRYNYHEKMAFSTLLQIWSYYDLPLPDNDKGKLLLLGIDSSFLGHYDANYKEVHNDYLVKLGFYELIKLLDKTTLNEAKMFKPSNDKVILKDGYVYLSDNQKKYLSNFEKQTGFKIIIPEGQFIKIKEFETDGKTIKDLSFNPANEEEVFSLAVTDKNYVIYSKKITKGN